MNSNWTGGQLSKAVRAPYKHPRIAGAGDRPPRQHSGMSNEEHHPARRSMHRDQAVASMSFAHAHGPPSNRMHPLIMPEDNKRDDPAHGDMTDNEDNDGPVDEITDLDDTDTEQQTEARKKTADIPEWTQRYSITKVTHDDPQIMMPDPQSVRYADEQEPPGYGSVDWDEFEAGPFGSEFDDFDDPDTPHRPPWLRKNEAWDAYWRSYPDDDSPWKRVGIARSARKAYNDELEEQQYWQSGPQWADQLYYDDDDDMLADAVRDGDETDRFPDPDFLEHIRKMDEYHRSQGYPALLPNALEFVSRLQPPSLHFARRDTPGPEPPSYHEHQHHEHRYHPYPPDERRRSRRLGPDAREPSPDLLTAMSTMTDEQAWDEANDIKPYQRRRYEIFKDFGKQLGLAITPKTFAPMPTNVIAPWCMLKSQRDRFPQYIFTHWENNEEGWVEPDMTEDEIPEHAGVGWPAMPHRKRPEGWVTDGWEVRSTEGTDYEDAADIPENQMDKLFAGRYQNKDAQEDVDAIKPDIEHGEGEEPTSEQVEGEMEQESAQEG